MKDDKDAIQELLRVARGLTVDGDKGLLVVKDDEAEMVEEALAEMVENGEIIDFVRVSHELLRVAKDLTADIGIKTLVVDDKDADIVEKDLMDMVERGEILDFVRVSRELVKIAKDLTADDYKRRLKARWDELTDIVSEFDQMLSINVELTDNQRQALTNAANLCDKAKLQLKKAK